MSGGKIHYPMLRAVGIFSLATGCILEFAYAKWSGKGTGEMSLFRSLLDSLQERDVIVADRLYHSYWLMAELTRRGVDFVFRLQDRRINTLSHLPAKPLTENDWEVRMLLGERSIPDWVDSELIQQFGSLKVRIVVVKVKRPGFRTRTLKLLTSLPLEFSAQQLGELYRMRWSCELDLRSLKRTLQMEELRTKDPDMVHKEIWANLLCYNLVRSLTVQAAGVHDLIPRDFSFKAAIQLFTALARAPWGVLLESMEAFLVHDRQLRHAPREVKRRRIHKYPVRQTA